MLRLLRKPFGWVRRRPIASVLVLLLALGILAVAGAEVWAMHAYQEAGRDMAEDRLDEASGQIGFCLAVWPWSADVHFRAAQIDRLRAAFPEAEKQLDECRRLQGQTARMQLEVLLSAPSAARWTRSATTCCTPPARTRPMSGTSWRRWRGATCVGCATSPLAFCWTNA